MVNTIYINSKHKVVYEHKKSTTCIFIYVKLRNIEIRKHFFKIDNFIDKSLCDIVIILRSLTRSNIQVKLWFP